MNITVLHFPHLSADSLQGFPRYEFHILARVRKKYQMEESLFMTTGNVILPDFRSVRVLAHKLNAQRDLKKHPEQAVKPGQLNALGLIDEIYHYILRVYEETTNPNVFARALAECNRTLGAGAQRTIHEFGSLFPPLEVYRGKISVEEYLGSSTRKKQHTEVTLEELILLYFANFNPAAIRFKELFDDGELKEGTAYSSVIDELERFFRKEKPFGPDHQFIFDLLRAPILASPNSLEGQLAYIKSKWGLILSGKFLNKILSADDLIEEDSKMLFLAGGGRGPTTIPTYQYHDIIATDMIDLERFTSDLEWMPKVVIIAKNTYVWLDQLSKKYQRSITRLNEIPTEELDQLARWNFTGLWLIGLWERSSASQKIKQMSGNPEAVSSAYSIYDYEIAADLGGEAAFQDLRRRAWERGIRLAGDIVPNHMGMYSKWVVEHPEYFIQADDPPYPNYKFSGSNLSDDPSIEVRIEDGYWNRTDAAVVFQRIDKRNGNVRYLYHGNDGTHMPWNDTAQLDFLKVDVREAVIQTIFHVARKFSIIRFDAAMVLTKKHFQRLWFPQPGTGGAIPSRSDYATPVEEFNKAMPTEFWRDVVDRINVEMPSTLLLAEAFWLLEGYFVRSLGMHRVYNSAFMHMLMKEENSKYRELIKNTMHYNPEILKRYVNFMSNPDEETAVAQFGKDDKYFGVCLLMVTLPGLPMFGHGQIDGFTEKYGMEYKRAYYDEQVDHHLIRRHEQEIFPVMKERHLFSQVTYFELYNFVDAHGNLNENVLAYSNRAGDERALICYHNKYEETAGWIRMSIGRNVGSTDEPAISRSTLAEALGIRGDSNYYYIFRDRKSNLEFLRSGKELHQQGLYVELKAFQNRIFMDFREIHDAIGVYRGLADHLQGCGVPDMQLALKEHQLVPVHTALQEFFSKQVVGDIVQMCFAGGKKSKSHEQKLNQVVQKFEHLLKQMTAVAPQGTEISVIAREFRSDLNALDEFFAEKLLGKTGKGKNAGSVQRTPVSTVEFGNGSADRNLLILISWLVARRLLQLAGADAFDRLGLAAAFERIFLNAGRSREELNDDLSLLRTLLNHQTVFKGFTKRDGYWVFVDFLELRDVQERIKVNVYNGVTYYNKESFEELMWWLFIVESFDQMRLRTPATKDTREGYDRLSHVLKMSNRSAFKFEALKRLFATAAETTILKT